MANHMIAFLVGTIFGICLASIIAAIVSGRRKARIPRPPDTRRRGIYEFVIEGTGRHAAYGEYDCEVEFREIERVGDRIRAEFDWNTLTNVPERGRRAVMRQFPTWIHESEITWLDEEAERIATHA